MKRLIVLVFVILVSISMVSAQGIKKVENIFKKNKIEPVVGVNTLFNEEGNSVEFMMGAHIDKAFSFYVGGFTLVNYQQNLTTGIKGSFVKMFWNIMGHADYESKIVGGVSISIATFGVNYESFGLKSFHEKTKITAVIPAVEFGYEFSWSRVTSVLKYVPYDNIYYVEANKFYGGISLIIPISIENHKNKWGY